MSHDEYLALREVLLRVYARCADEASKRYISRSITALEEARSRNTSLSTFLSSLHAFTRRAVGQEIVAHHKRLWDEISAVEDISTALKIALKP
jgi:hypothetical protein